MLREIANNLFELMSNNNEIVIGMIVLGVFLTFLINRIQNKESKD